MSDEDAQPTTPEEMARWMVEPTGGEVAGPVVCEREPGGAWYCEVPLRGGGRGRAACSPPRSSTSTSTTTTT
ncbi:MAG: hypothetical protein QOH30_1344 [Baekduia sp.]|nr:hypothetical protein [Baekduia sp.]